MARLVAIGLGESDIVDVRGIAADYRLRVDVLDEPQLHGGEDIEAVVLGELPDPRRVLHRCQASAPRALVMIFASESTCETVQQAIRLSPFGGRFVECVPTTRRDQLRARLRAAIDARRRRGHTQTVLAALNKKLEQTPPPRLVEAAVLDRLLEIAPIGIVITDRAARIRDTNRRATELLDAHGGTLAGVPLLDRFPEAEHGRLRELLASLDHEARGVPHQAFTCRGNDIDRRLEVRGIALPASAGGPGYLLVLEDVTERQSLLSELRSANRAKDDFIAMLGHELRNPLAPIRTAVELLRLRHGSAVQRECDTIDRHVMHVVQLVDDLLDVSRIVRGKLELRRVSLEIATAISESLEMASPLLEQRSHRVEVDVPQRGLEVKGDRSRLAQVFANLLTNAAKYTPTGGLVSVRARREADEVVVRVRDTGSGIAPELQPHIFDLFVQERQAIDRARGGLGLGLAIVRSLVKLHGGSVSVESELGKGSELTVRLPAVAMQTAQPTPQPGAPVAERRRARLEGLRVLVVDDNVDAAELLGDYLRTFGAHVELAHDGPEAIRAVEHDAPHAVLLDIGLPLMDGYEVAERLRALIPDIKCIAVSGYGQEQDLQRSTAAGFAAHLVKPVVLSLLPDVLQDAVAEVWTPSQ